MSTVPYSTYVESGIEWSRRIPSHWKVVPLLAVADEAVIKNVNLQSKVRLSLSYGRIKIKDFTSNDGLLPESFETYHLVCKGDVVLRLIDLQNDRVSLRSAASNFSGMTSPAYLILRPKRITGAYFAYLLRFYDIVKVFYALGGGLRQSVGFDDIRRLPIIMPSAPEQHAIAAFLDRETAKIDALVAEQECLLALLTEKRKAVISRAVTQGLDPSVPMKDSGVEWLGKVPEYWSIQAVWTMFNLGRGRVLSHEAIADAPGPYPVYSSQTENDGMMGFIDTFDFDGDFLTWTTDGANAGTVFRRSGKFNCTNVCGILKPKIRLNLNFFLHILNNATAFYVRKDINPKLMNGVMGRIRIPRPTLDEQIRIISFCERHVGHFQTLMDEVYCSIRLLKERRAALISAAVTGKIDVRGAVPLEEDSKEAA